MEPEKLKSPLQQVLPFLKFGYFIGIFPFKIQWYPRITLVQNWPRFCLKFMIWLLISSTLAIINFVAPILNYGEFNLEVIKKMTGFSSLDIATILGFSAINIIATFCCIYAYVKIYKDLSDNLSHFKLCFNYGLESKSILYKHLLHFSILTFITGTLMAAGCYLLFESGAGDRYPVFRWCYGLYGFAVVATNIMAPLIIYSGFFMQFLLSLTKEEYDSVLSDLNCFALKLNHDLKKKKQIFNMAWKLECS